MSKEPKGATLSYLRVSTKAQEVEPQRLAIQKAGYDVDREFVDAGISGRKASRPALDEMLTYAREGDRIIIYSLSRLGRSTLETLQLLEDLRSRGVAVVSLTESIDTSTPVGKIMTTLLAALAEMEADLVRERTLAGLAAARAQGKTGGRPRVPADKVAAYREFRRQGMSQTKAAAAAGIGRGTAQRIDASMTGTT